MSAQASHQEARADAVRFAVADLYKAHPYPDHGVVSTVAARLASPLVERARNRRPGQTIRVLDAGCGTGEQALGVARMYPDLQVVGFDANEQSIERARHHARRHALRVDFAVHDLLREPPADTGEFDLFISIGVLHHLPFPEQALKIFGGMAAPGAELLGMVYGRFGNLVEFNLRDAVSLLAGTDDRALRLDVLRGIRPRLDERVLSGAAEVLRRLRFGPRVPLHEVTRRLLAGRNVAYRADRYTHAHELTFSWRELAETLEAAGWRWSGWPERSGMPDRPSQVFRGQALANARRLDRPELAAVYERLLCLSKLYFVAARP